jgi:hypothetical protein
VVLKGSPGELTIQNGTHLLMVVKLKERNRKKRERRRAPSSFRVCHSHKFRDPSRCQCLNVHRSNANVNEHRRTGVESHGADTKMWRVGSS